MSHIFDDLFLLVFVSVSMIPPKCPSHRSRRFNYSDYCKPSVIVMRLGCTAAFQLKRANGPNYDTRSDLFAAAPAGWFMYTSRGKRNRRVTQPKTHASRVIELSCKLYLWHETSCSGELGELLEDLQSSATPSETAACSCRCIAVGVCLCLCLEREYAWASESSHYERGLCRL